MDEWWHHRYVLIKTAHNRRSDTSQSAVGSVWMFLYKSCSDCCHGDVVTVVMVMCSGDSVWWGGGCRIQRTLLKTGWRRKVYTWGVTSTRLCHHTCEDGRQVCPDLQVSSCDVFPFVFQDMEISAVELRTIMNKIVSKRTSKLKLQYTSPAHLLTYNFLSLPYRNWHQNWRLQPGDLQGHGQPDGRILL